MVVSVTFNVFGTQLSSDFIRIYDGFNTSSRLIAALSGTNLNQYTYSSTQKYMYIRFTSNISDTYPGFAAVFQSTCEYLLTSEQTERSRCFKTGMLQFFLKAMLPSKTELILAELSVSSLNTRCHY